MKRILLVFSLCIAVFGLQASNNKSAEQLQRLLPSKNGVEKMEVYQELVVELINSKEFTKASQAAADAKSYATTSEGDQASRALAFEIEGMLYTAKFDYTNAMGSLVEALRLRNNLGNDLDIANVKQMMGMVHFKENNNEQAIENIQAALDVREANNKPNLSAESYQSLGDVYVQKKIFGQATEAYRKAMDLKIKVEDMQGASAIASLLGQISNNLGDSESALAYFKMSLDMNNSSNNLPLIAKDYNNITLAQIDTRALEDAMESNRLAFNIRKDLDDPIALAETHKNFGIIYSKMKNNAKGEASLETAMKLLRKNKEKAGAPEIYAAISKAYAKMKNYKKAYQAHTNYSRSRDANFDRQKSKELLKLTTKYESEFAAAEQATKIETLEAEKSHQAKVRYFLLALMGLGVMLSGVLFYSYKRKQKDNMMLTAKNAEIERQSGEIDSKNVELEDKNTSLDMLNQKLLEEIAERESIEQSSFARDRFLATMSHEMRTPMNIIIGLAHLLLEEDPRPDQIEHLRTLQFSANNLIVFINDVLDFSKIEAGKLNLESRVFNPMDTLMDTKKRFQLPAKDKGLSFNYEFDSEVPKALMGDPARLNQIITNLVSNAVNFTEKGEVNVSVDLNTMDSREATLLITIEDTGKGIDPEHLEAMFQKFSRKGQDIFEGYANSGLGLAITKRLVDLQNGKIEVDSKMGQGTTFTIYLPYKLANPEMEAAEQNRQKKAGEKQDYSHMEGMKILLVEDNKINQLVVAKMLRKMGMEVITTDNGAEALDAFNESYFDLVLMDIQMPVMDGYRATAEIRKSNDPRKRDVPIIALTASAFLTEKDKAKLFGMNDHVGKPFGPDELLDKMGACIAVFKNT